MIFYIGISLEHLNIALTYYIIRGDDREYSLLHRYFNRILDISSMNTPKNRVAMSIFREI